MKQKFTRRTLIDSMESFELNFKNRSDDLTFLLKNKSSKLLFLYLYLLDNLVDRFIIYKVLSKRRFKLNKYDRAIVFPEEGKVDDKAYMYSYRKNFFKVAKIVRFSYYIKDYLSSNLNFITGYISTFGDIANTSRMNSEFNFLNELLNEEYNLSSHVSSKRLPSNALEFVNSKYHIDDHYIRKFNRLSLNDLKSSNVIKIMLLLQDRLNLRFASYFKILHNIFNEGRYLLINDYIELGNKFNIDFSFLKFNKLIFERYVSHVMMNSGNNNSKKKIIMSLIGSHRFN